MINEKFHNQVTLLLKVLPEVAKESCFALHGGTAINLFVRNMPRLSVDIDLTYIRIENRIETIKNINYALNNINGMRFLDPGEYPLVFENLPDF